MRGTKDSLYLNTLKNALKSIKEFSPEFMVIALGLDACEGDPYEGMLITTEVFSSIPTEISKLKLPPGIIQEGGYLSSALGDNLNSFLKGFENF